MVAWAALVLALLGNIAQYTTLRSAQQRAANQLKLATARWSNERSALEHELDQLRRQVRLTPQDRAMLTIELDKIRFDLVNYEQQIYKAEVERATASRLLKDYEDLQKPKLAETQQKIIAAIDRKMEFLRTEQNSLLSRRSELQSQLN
jgi:hypothetical protein